MTWVFSFYGRLLDTPQPGSPMPNSLYSFRSVGEPYQATPHPCSCPQHEPRQGPRLTRGTRKQKPCKLGKEYKEDTRRHPSGCYLMCCTNQPTNQPCWLAFTSFPSENYDEGDFNGRVNMVIRL